MQAQEHGRTTKLGARTAFGNMTAQLMNLYTASQIMHSMHSGVFEFDVCAFVPCSCSTFQVWRRSTAPSRSQVASTHPSSSRSPTHMGGCSGSCASATMTFARCDSCWPPCKVICRSAHAHDVTLAHCLASLVAPRTASLLPSTDCKLGNARSLAELPTLHEIIVLCHWA